MAPSTSGDESLERLYKYCRRVGCTTDAGEYADLDELTEGLGATVDQLRPIIERGLTQKTLAVRWFKGEQRFAVTTPSYLAAKAAEAQRAAEGIADWFGDDEPNPKKTGKPAAKRRGKPEPKTKAAGKWSYAQVPRAAFRDPELSMAARMAVCALADAWNVNGKKNPARIIKASYDALAERMGTDKRTAIRAVAKLERTGWITITRGKGHGSNRYRFTSKVRS